MEGLPRELRECFGYVTYQSNAGAVAEEPGTMIVTVDIEINKSKETIWTAITDIKNSSNMIPAILKINVLNNPADSFVGFKWEETREVFGKKAMETMWVTDAVANQYYCTRAESHGSIYITKLSLSENSSSTLLTMSFGGEAQSVTAKIMSFLMGFMIKGSIKKALNKDLQDIKQYVENGPG